MPVKVSHAISGHVSTRLADKPTENLGFCMTFSYLMSDAFLV